MPVTMDWDDQAQSIILVNFTEPWTWPEYRETIERLKQMTADTSREYDVIYHFHPGETPPFPNLEDIAMMMEALRAHVELVVLVGGPMSHPGFANMLLKLRGVHTMLRHVDQLDQAYDLIGQRRRA